ncbi:hypothetical protein L6164_032539 [Bauhinia variegata]|uniref:Uncharacterized protein n=1 Tax=Bauhinia variegata TaxID=167791 RepID=A0ACB9KPD7_BAUVA|nr:hypothetical protein L6164_032539 [Bauhinia variegata]
MEYNAHLMFSLILLQAPPPNCFYSFDLSSSPAIACGSVRFSKAMSVSDHVVTTSESSDMKLLECSVL